MLKIFTPIIAWLKSAFTTVEAVVDPAIKDIEKGIPSILIAAVQALLAGVATGTPFAVVGATIESIAEAQGIKLVEGAAQVAYNIADSNQITAGTPSPTTVAATAAIAEATPLPADHPAVLAATAVITTAATTATVPDAAVVHSDDDVTSTVAASTDAPAVNGDAA